MMWKIRQMRTQVVNLRFDEFADARRQFQENRIKLARINLGRLPHASFG